MRATSLAPLLLALLALLVSPAAAQTGSGTGNSGTTTGNTGNTGSTTGNTGSTTGNAGSTGSSSSSPGVGSSSSGNVGSTSNSGTSSSSGGDTNGGLVGNPGDTGVISGSGNQFARPAFLWPPTIQTERFWQVPVIARGSIKYPLNASWTLDNMDSPPSQFMLQYFRDSDKNYRNLTTVSSSTTNFTWSVPAENIDEGRDYRLRLIDNTAPALQSSFRPVQSGLFYIYRPTDLRIQQALPPPSAAPAGSQGMLAASAVAVVAAVMAVIA
ncbi:hypothetical protein BC828DRAFT_380334 [Blastocladiella britannica]|nr:hypothetical protein BC828DRAFT_380334 [Blastocladiella britannica]